eukprot:14994613-Alexandrium_andersonii.AAC.1
MPSRPGLTKDAHPCAAACTNQPRRGGGHRPRATPRGHAPRTKPQPAGRHAHAHHMEGVGRATSRPLPQCEPQGRCH